MILKFKYSSQEEIPEHMMPLYAEVNGEYVLQVGEIEGVSPNAKLKEFRDSNTSLKTERDDLVSKLAVFQDVNVDEYKDLQAKKQEFEDGKYIENKDIEGLIADRTKRMAEDHSKEVSRFQDVITAANSKTANLTSELASVKIDNALSSEASKLEGLNPAMHDIVVMLGKQQFKMNENNEPEARNNGELIYGKDGLTAITIPEWIGTIPDSRPDFMVGSKGMDSNGSGNSIKTGGDLKNVKGRAKLDNFFADAVK